MKSSTKKILRVVISIVYIIWGLASPIAAWNAILALDVAAIISAAVGLITLLAGIFGLTGLKRSTCRLFGVILFILAVLACIPVFLAFNLWALISNIITAILAWLFIACL